MNPTDRYRRANVYLYLLIITTYTKKNLPTTGKKGNNSLYRRSIYLYYRRYKSSVMYTKNIPVYLEYIRIQMFALGFLYTHNKIDGNLFEYI